MADSLVLGLTRTAVEGTLSRVQTAIDVETKLKVNVQNDLVFITGEFQMMQSFLNVATRERAKNDVVRTWLRQLRELAFDVEDVIEVVVHLDKDKSTWWWRVLPSCMSPPRPLDEVAKEIKLIKDRVEAVSQRNTRYNLILGGSETFSRTTVVVSPSTSDDLSSHFQAILQMWRKAGKIRNIGIRELITREEGSTDDLQVISLLENDDNNHEMSYIINEAYHDPKICRRFQRRAWVKITRPFNPDKLINTLLTQLLFKVGSSHQATKDIAKATEVLQQVSKEQRYLLVVEGVSDVLEWNTIRKYLPENNNGSRIIVVTPHMGIGILCTGKPYLVSVLKQSPSLYAFYKRVAGSRCDMGELLWQIKCGGLISVESYHTNIKVVDIKNLYCNIRAGCEEFDGVRFKTHRWVPVVYPFNLIDFSRRLLVDVGDEFYDGDLKELAHTGNKWCSGEEVYRVISMADVDVIECCRKLLHEDDSYLLVIDDVTTRAWDLIKETFFSEPIKGCVVVTRYTGILSRKFLKGIFSSRHEEARAWMSESFDPVSAAKTWGKYWIMPMSFPAGVVSVWGIPGVGKSTFARWSYYSDMLARSYEEEQYCWADVPHPFCLTELSRRLLLDFHSDDLPAKEDVAISIMEGKDPVQVFRQLLHPYIKCLIVLDGLRSTDDWDSLKEAFGWHSFYQIRIIVVTDELSVARHCVDNNHKKVVNVQGLDEDDAFHLFIKKIGYPGYDNQLNEEELQLSKLIVTKCGGLPKVIVAVAEYWKNIILLPFGFDIKKFHDTFMYTVENDVKGFKSLRGLFSWMQSYLETCKDSLKPCIFYLPIFPRNHTFRQKRLLRRWIAEGYSRDTISGTAEENGERLLYELVDLSIIQKPSSKSLCQVNGLFHEYITSRPMEDNLVLTLEGHCKINSQRVGRHLSMQKSWDRDMTVFESIDFSRLRSFTVFGEWSPLFFSKPITNNKMRLVRVLDLEDTTGLTDDDLAHIGELLPLLKFLSLRGCREITHLPNSLGVLRQLQTLDVRYTSIVTLPPAVIVKLRKLQYVRAGTKTAQWEEGGIMVTCQPQPTEQEEEDTSAAPAPVVATQDAHGGTNTPRDEGGIMVPCQPQPTEPSEVATEASVAQAQEATKTSSGVAPRNMSGAYLPTFLSKMCCIPKVDGDDMDGCVEVPIEIGNLTTMHTLGDINVGAGKGIIKELKRLSQLCRLRVSGINVDNIHEFFSVISSLNHLEYLTVRVQSVKNMQDHSFACVDDTTSPPPKALKILKLYGHVRILSENWVKQLDNIEMMDVEMIILAQEEMYVFRALPRQNVFRRLCVRPIQVTELCFGRGRTYFMLNTKVLEIDCTSELNVIFERPSTEYQLELLKVNCSNRSILQFYDMHNLRKLKEVWLKGSYSDEVKQNLLEQLEEHTGRPILKILQSRASSSVQLN